MKHLEHLKYTFATCVFHAYSSRRRIAEWGMADSSQPKTHVVSLVYVRRHKIIGSKKNPLLTLMLLGIDLGRLRQCLGFSKTVVTENSCFFSSALDQNSFNFTIFYLILALEAILKNVHLTRLLIWPMKNLQQKPYQRRP
jgi:hypothetical protein